MVHLMRRLVLGAMLAFVVFAPAPAFAAQDVRATVDTEANLRERPNTTSTVRAVMPVGTEVTVVCWAEGEDTLGSDMWLYLTRDGWVHSTLVTPVDVPPCSTSNTGIFFDNCDEARAAGAAPVLATSPGYGIHLDRDRDGIGCEPPG